MPERAETTDEPPDVTVPVSFDTRYMPDAIDDEAACRLGHRVFKRARREADRVAEGVPASAPKQGQS